MNLNKLFYIGSGVHLQPVNDFPDTKEFVFIDSQPFTEGYYFHFDMGFYRNKFIDNLLNKAKIYNFDLIDEKIINKQFFWNSLCFSQKLFYSFLPHLIPNYVNPTLLTFKNNNTNQIIKYYVSTPLPLQHHKDKLIELENDIKTSDGIILSGHFPNLSILDYFPNKPISFIGYSGTCFSTNDFDEYDFDNLFYHTFKLSDIERNLIFKSFIYVHDAYTSYFNNLEHNTNFSLDYQEYIHLTDQYIHSNLTKSEYFIFDSLQEFLSKYNNKSIVD